MKEEPSPYNGPVKQLDVHGNRREGTIRVVQEHGVVLVPIRARGTVVHFAHRPLVAHDREKTIGQLT